MSGKPVGFFFAIEPEFRCDRVGPDQSVTRHWTSLVCWL
jgi:hypothetical protein